MKKIVNVLIHLCNVFNYFAHLETFSHCKAEYEPYDFSRDTAYYK